MAAKKKVVNAREDESGNISHVQFAGNQKFTSVETAIGMAEQNKIENAHAVTRKDGTQFLRSNPNNKSRDNLDEMAQD
jgi:hypothetical protein